MYIPPTNTRIVWSECVSRGVRVKTSHTSCYVVRTGIQLGDQPYRKYNLQSLILTWLALSREKKRKKQSPGHPLQQDAKFYGEVTDSIVKVRPDSCCWWQSPIVVVILALLLNPILRERSRLLCLMMGLPGFNRVFWRCSSQIPLWNVNRDHFLRLCTCDVVYKFSKVSVATQGKAASTEPILYFNPIRTGTKEQRPVTEFSHGSDNWMQGCLRHAFLHQR